MKIDRMIPGLEMRAFKPALKEGCVSVEIEMVVTSWLKLFWHIIRTEYDVRWWQWPYVLFVIAKVSLTERLRL